MNEVTSASRRHAEPCRSGKQAHPHPHPQSTPEAPKLAPSANACTHLPVDGRRLGLGGPRSRLGGLRELTQELWQRAVDLGPGVGGWVGLGSDVRVSNDDAGTKR